MLLNFLLLRNEFWDHSLFIYKSLLLNLLVATSKRVDYNEKYLKYRISCSGKILV